MASKRAPKVSHLVDQQSTMSQELGLSRCPVVHSSPASPHLRRSLSEDAFRIIAFATKGVSMQIVPASPDRNWMNATEAAFANRCLPMRIANQNGWVLLNPDPIELVWNGGRKQSDLRISHLGKERHRFALSHFGHGIVTWWIPYIFRTPTGFNMHVRGPANHCKDGISPLDAVVETDWAVASFPMSWKMTRVAHPVRFEGGEPICMISPIRRAEVEAFNPEIVNLADDPVLEMKFTTWSESRREFLTRQSSKEAEKGKWQKHYFIGTSPGDEDQRFVEHQVRLHLKPFHQSRLAPTPMKVELDDAKPDNRKPRRKRGKLAVEKVYFEQFADLQHHIKLCLGPAHGRSDVAQQVWQFIEPGLSMTDATHVFPRDLAFSLRERFQAGTGDEASTAMRLLLITPGYGKQRLSVKVASLMLVLPLVCVAKSFRIVGVNKGPIDGRENVGVAVDRSWNLDLDQHTWNHNRVIVLLLIEGVPKGV